MDAPGDRREYLADWLVSPENPYFTRAIANRVWANFLGVALSSRSTTCASRIRLATRPLLDGLASSWSTQISISSR